MYYDIQIDCRIDQGLWIGLDLLKEKAFKGFELCWMIDAGTLLYISVTFFAGQLFAAEQETETQAMKIESLQGKSLVLLCDEYIL